MAESESSKRLALGLWEAPPGSGEPLVCIATSFTFDATFFETECLGRFLQMDHHPAESDSVGYLIEREEKLAAARVCVLVDRRHARNKESLRWDVLGVLITGGIQHSKVALLAWGNHVRLIVGSGNLTEPGYRRNLEVFGTIELSKTDGGDRTAIEQSLDFLEEVLERAVGDPGSATPRGRARDALAAVRGHMARWPAKKGSRSAPAVPVFGLPERGVLDQLLPLCPAGGPPRVAAMVSPFFDRSGDSSVTVDTLIGLLAKKRPRAVDFYIRAEDLPGGKVRAYVPLDAIERAQSSCDVRVLRVSREQQGELRDLHAKMVLLANDQWSLLLVGSSNFTAAGLCARAGRGNFEANLVYRTKASGSELRRFESIWPEIDDDELDPSSASIHWDPDPEELEGGEADLALPAAFREALFLPDGDARLLIRLAEKLPSEWSIRTSDGLPLLSSETGAGAGEHLLPWTGLAVPLVLSVSWEHASGEAVAGWPVNVSDPSALPPPDSLKDLTLEELLAVLASTRTISQAVVQVLQKRSARVSREFELDPLKRLDSPAFLLRRTKRVAIALERLRERLERPALTVDAFEWRVRGPVGPLALARAFAKEATWMGESRFYFAELALALKRVKPEAVAAGGLSAKLISEIVSGAIGELESQASEIPPRAHSVPVDEYAAAAFREARRR